jgi:tryptophan synthase alpha chain
MSRIGRRFEELRREGRRAFIAYVTAGDPNAARTPAIVAALERGGADVIELGVPFSDPVADGPVIQRACERALSAGTSLAAVLDIARVIRRDSEIPLLLFTYLNPVVRYGLEKLARDAKSAGIDGCLLTDLSVEEAGPYTSALHAAGLDTVFLAAPTSTEARRRRIAECSSGFIYLVSRTGVTGERDSLSESAAPLVSSMRNVTDLPLAVGFGISRPEHVTAAGAVADGVVVGSAFVRLIEAQGGAATLESDVESLARSLSEALPRRNA